MSRFKLGRKSFQLLLVSMALIGLFHSLAIGRISAGGDTGGGSTTSTTIFVTSARSTQFITTISSTFYSTVTSVFTSASSLVTTVTVLSFTITVLSTVLSIYTTVVTILPSTPLVTPQTDFWVALTAIGTVVIAATSVVALRRSSGYRRKKKSRKAAPLKFEITQRQSNGTKRTFPSVGFNIRNNADCHLRVRVLAEVLLDGKPLGYPSDWSGHYTGEKVWNLNARSGLVDGNFTIPLAGIGKDQQLVVKVTVKVVNKEFDSPLPMGWVYMVDQNNWFYEPTV